MPPPRGGVFFPQKRDLAIKKERKCWANPAWPQENPSPPPPKKTIGDYDATHKARPGEGGKGDIQRYSKETISPTPMRGGAPPITSPGILPRKKREDSTPRRAGKKLFKVIKETIRGVFKSKVGIKEKWEFFSRQQGMSEKIFPFFVDA